MAVVDAAKARMSSKGQIAIPKPIRDQLGLDEGTDLSIRVEGDSLILRKFARDRWRRWRGKNPGSPLLKDLAKERRVERRRDAKGA